MQIPKKSIKLNYGPFNEFHEWLQLQCSLPDVQFYGAAHKIIMANAAEVLMKVAEKLILARTDYSLPLTYAQQLVLKFLIEETMPLRMIDNPYRIAVLVDINIQLEKHL